MSKKKIFITIILVLIALLVVAVISERKNHFLSGFIDSAIMDNKNHYLPCDQLPSVEEVDQTVKAHKDVVEKMIVISTEKLSKKL